MIRSALILLGVGAAAFSFAAPQPTPFWQPDTESEISLRELPDAVRAAAVAFFGTLDDASAEREVMGDVVLYEVSGERADRDIEATFTATGHLVALELEADEADLPSAVLRRLEERFGDLEIEDVSAVQTFQYEIEAERGDREFEIMVSPSGRIIAVESQKPKRPRPVD